MEQGFLFKNPCVHYFARMLHAIDRNSIYPVVDTKIPIESLILINITMLKSLVIHLFEKNSQLSIFQLFKGLCTQGGGY
jgi:hypothetical protein